jgi:hypothetical protein
MVVILPFKLETSKYHLTKFSNVAEEDYLELRFSLVENLSVLAQRMDRSTVYIMLGNSNTQQQVQIWCQYQMHSPNMTKF